MEKKNIYYIIGAFAAGALLMGAVAFGTGNLMQGYLGQNLPGKSQNPTPPGGCNVTACQVQAKLEKSIQVLNLRLSEVENASSSLNNHINSLVEGLWLHFTDVENELQYLTSTVNWLAPYTTSHFTETSNKFVELGVGALAP